MTFVIQRWYCEDKLDASHSNEQMVSLVASEGPMKWAE